MKKIITLLSLILTFTMTSQIQDDKIKHFAAGAFIGGGVQSIVYSQTRNTAKAFLWGLGSSITIGVLKEVKDEIDYGGFDTKDLLATILGGLTVTIPLDFVFKKHKRK